MTLRVGDKIKKEAIFDGTTPLAERPVEAHIEFTVEQMTPEFYLVGAGAHGDVGPHQWVMLKVQK